MKTTIQSFKVIVFVTLVCGLVYPFLTTGISQLFFPYQANGSLIEEQGKVVGSALIGQEFTAAKYLQGRPQVVSQKSFSEKEQQKLYAKRTAQLAKANQTARADVPQELVTASGSGLDRFISPAAADYQINRIAQAQNLPKATIKRIIQKHTKGRLLGLFGQPTVDVLAVNLELKKIA